MAKGTPRRDGSGRFLKGIVPANKITLPQGELKELYSRMGSQLIARYFNVSKPTILRNLHDYNIKMREVGAPSVMPEYWVDALRKPKAIAPWSEGKTKDTNPILRGISDKLKGANNPRWKPELHTGEMIECACGCGGLIPKFDKKGRRRSYEAGHCSKGFFKEGSVAWNKGKQWSRDVIKKMLTRRSPNKQEDFLIEFFAKNNFPYQFVGDGKIIIGNRNPDFINCNGQKKIIEFFGEHWHKLEDEEVKRKIYARYGYKMLGLWGKDIKDEQKLFEVISSFDRR